MNKMKKLYFWIFGLLILTLFSCDAILINDYSLDSSDTIKKMKSAEFADSDSPIFSNSSIDTIKYFPIKEDLLKLYNRNINSGKMNKLSFICLPYGLNYKHAFYDLIQNFEIDAVVYTSYTKYGWNLSDTTMIINALDILQPSFKLMNRLPIKIGDNISDIDKSKIDTILAKNIHVAKYYDCMIAYKIDSDTIFRMFIWKHNCDDSLLNNAYKSIQLGLNETIY